MFIVQRFGYRRLFAAIAVFVLFRLHFVSYVWNSLSLSVQFCFLSMVAVFCFRPFLHFTLHITTLLSMLSMCVGFATVAFGIASEHSYAGVLLQGSACFYRAFRYGTHTVHGMRPFFFKCFWIETKSQHRMCIANMRER